MGSDWLGLLGARARRDEERNWRTVHLTRTLADWAVERREVVGQSGLEGMMDGLRRRRGELEGLLGLSKGLGD